MAESSGSFPSLVQRWRKLLQAAREHELEFPQLGPFAAALEEALEDLTVLKTRQLDLRAKCEQATQDFKDERACGSEAERKLKSFVRAVFGRSDERLAEFGIKPLARSWRRRKEESKGGSPGCTHRGR